ncbi:hypothetical protein XELAEV_18021553mg [Xenopus laevis]|uniref:Cadherin domain-containing protein n=1 Tax=Xenopus laevis TaxID=8355 RepID=A0A974DBB7_XENLA|nr:hypothetical protein XELAEV_18021553mg [Xenopus laevis]
MNILSSKKAWQRQVVYSFFLCIWGWVSGQIRYSIVEGSATGTVVGNVAQDLGLHLTDISTRRLHLESERSKRQFTVTQANGDLIVKERIDREDLCASSSSCILPVNIVAEHPLKLFSLEIEIVDINDNSPSFSVSDQIVKITEVFAIPGVRFPLETAHDADVGINGIRQYQINPNPYFSLSVKNRKDGTVIPELVLEKALDREEREEHKLVLTALDGGEPARVGTCQITVIVLDINDNPPIFGKSSYKVKLLENAKLNTILMTLNATDLDKGANGEIEYYFDGHTSDSAKKLFYLNSNTGEIYIKGLVDFEESNFHELSVSAKDKGIPELEGRCLIQVEIEDVNDNTPEIILTSVLNDVPEDAALVTEVAFLTVRDSDSGKNGEVKLMLSPNLPFKIKSLQNHYSLVTDGLLDREKISQYRIQIIAIDLGLPPLQTDTAIVLNVSDVNDNSPVFLQSHYNSFMKENNNPGSFLCIVSATDADEGVNAQLIYSVVDSQVDGFSVSTFVYINPQNGHLYAQRAFDYEQIQVFQVSVRAEDSGVPKLFCDVTVSIFVLDTNDNYPVMINPEYSKDFISGGNIPKSASPGYLVTKISAVDLDSGHNAWLLFSLIDDSYSPLFKVSAHTGEIRTIRDFQDTDNKEQHVVVLIRDHGEPSLSTTGTLVINIIENVEEQILKSNNFLANSNTTVDLTLYLIVSLVAISLVSLVTFIILLMKCLKREHYIDVGICCFTNESHSAQHVDQYKPALYLNTDGTLKYMEVRMVPSKPQGQCYQPCFQTALGKPDASFIQPLNRPQLKDTFNENEVSSDASIADQVTKILVLSFQEFK